MGQRLYNLIKAAKGEHVPVSHLVAVTKADRNDVTEYCERLVTIGKAESRYERNGQAHELHYWVKPKAKGAKR